MKSIDSSLSEQYTFDQTLLLAMDMENLALAAVKYFGNLGAKHVKMIWCTSSPTIAGCLTFPNLALNEIQTLLLEQAINTRQSAEKAIGETNYTIEILSTSENHGASLHFEFDMRETDPRHQPLWQQAFNNLALRCQSMMQNEHLGVELIRISKAEKLQRALFAISDLAHSDKESNYVLQEIHQIVCSLMYAENFYIVRYDKIDNTLRFIYFVDTHDIDWQDSNCNIKVHPHEMPNSLTFGLLKLGQPLHGSTHKIREILNLPHDSSIGPDSFDWMGIPMIDLGEVEGAVVIQSYKADFTYSDDDQTLLTHIAHHIWTVIQRREAHELLEKRVNERTVELQQEIVVRQRAELLQHALFRITEISQASMTIDDFYWSIHDVISSLMSAENFYVAFLSSDDKHIEFPYYVDKFKTDTKSRPLRKGFTEFLLRTGKTCRLTRADIELLEQEGEVHELAEAKQTLCWLGSPIFISGNVRGVIALNDYDNESAYTLQDKEVISYIAVHISTALERRLNQENLRIAYNELEERVAERTQELANANAELHEQMIVRERFKEALVHETLHDSLTGLANRVQLLARLNSVLKNFHDDSSRLFAIFFLDLDRFKFVNDTAGHLVGDQLLIQVARKLNECVRAPDLIARLGGDEFAIVLENIKDHEYVVRIADRIIQALSQPIDINGKEFYTSASIGIVLSNEQYSNPEELLRDADVAMYRAKASGRRRYAMFDEDFHTIASDAMEVEHDLFRALPRKEFLPYYQPIMRLTDGKLIGFEALIRWQHPERGLLSPIDFLTTAEESGNIETMDWQIYEQVCLDSHSLASLCAYISVNVSPMHLRNKTFAERFLSMLNRHQVKPECIRLEITEGALLEDPEQVTACLLSLKNHGVQTLLDDFGTGYSSLSYLHRFPLSGIKIDRSFVNALLAGEEGGSSAIVHAICLMAESLGLDVIAEGIETEEQLKQLLVLGLTLGQGYYFARPVSTQEICKQYMV